MGEKYTPEPIVEDKPKLSPEEKRYQQAVKEGPVKNALRLQEAHKQQENREKGWKNSQKRPQKKSGEQTNLPL